MQDARCMSIRIPQLESYDYFLPRERIAQHPVSPRDQSKLLFVSRATQTLQDYGFRDLPGLLQPGDLLVINNTKVFPARLRSDKGEILLVRPVDNECWD